MVVKKNVRKVAQNPYLTEASPDELGPANRIAYDIVADTVSTTLVSDRSGRGCARLMVRWSATRG